MRKIYLLLAGALLYSLPAVSQLTFQRHAEDARLIFHQDFEVADGLTPEQAYTEWSTTPIDTIREIEYYAKLGTGTPRVDIYAAENLADWSVFMVRRDSTSSEHTTVNPGDGIVMFNGADPTSSQDEINAGVYDRDVWEIVGDNGEDAERIAAFKKYGEDGGKYYFQWQTAGLDGYVGGAENKDKPNYAGKNWSSQWKSDTHSTAKHRRDLYVRGLDIEDESSYRLTFFVKTNKLNTWGPKFYADVMRGYHHQRAAFSMGYMSGKEFALEMTPENFTNNEWQKVTLMTYYINDHEADGYVIYNGSYSWDDDWTWRPSDAELTAAGKSLAAGEVLNYVKQPDKFFVRLSFCTDSIIYSLDNLSLTKSWIAGCEYNGDILRINFGYETNLGKLVKEEKARTNMPALEVPNMAGRFFQVWCKKGEQWSYMPIRSAEYHDDGYMYMFTDYYPVDEEDPDTEYETYKFGNYDSVFVTFHNPVELPELTLKYTGSLYPKALDTAWVNAGKIVPDFYNEVAVPNPTRSIWAGVSSLDGIAPVMIESQFEEGSFGLDANIRTLKFKFQKQIKIDDVFTGENTQNTKGVIAYVGNEVWEPTWDALNKELIITRPDDYSDPLSGDYEIHITQVKGMSGDAGSDVFRHYHFGDFSTEIGASEPYMNSNWRSEIESFNTATGCTPTSTYVHDCSSTFRKGTGLTADKAKTRLYCLGYGTESEVDYDNCCFVIVSRSDSEGDGKTGNVYTIVNFEEAGNYSISFKAAAWTTVGGAETNVYIYLKPDGTLADGDENGFATLNGVKNKTIVGSPMPSKKMSTSGTEDKTTGTWPTGVETFEYTFKITTPGEYVIEWATLNGNKNGIAIGNFFIRKEAAANLSTNYVKKLINAITDAETKLAEVTDNKYKGTDFNNLTQAVSDNKSYKGNYPSKYDSIVAYINTCLSALTVRAEAVDLYYTTEKNASDKLAAFTGDSAKYKNMVTYKAIEDHLEANADLVPSEKSNTELNTEVENYEAEMDALDARMALIDKFNDKIKETKALMDAKDARKDYDEYATMTAGYNAALLADVITTADSVVTKATTTLNDAKNAYLFRFDYVIARTRQIKELYALADTLGYDFAGFGGKKDSIKALIYALEDDDPTLSEALRMAAILQINKAYAEKKEATLDKLYGLNVSALIPNYFLCNDADITRDLKKSGSGNWYIQRKENSNVIPGWTITPNSSSGYWYFTMAKVEDVYAMNSYIDWEADGHVFIGGLRSATSTKGVLETKVTGLPEGYYKVGLFAYNQTSDLAFEFKTDSVTIGGNLNEKMNGGKSNKFKFKEVGIDSVLVVGTLNYKIDQQSSSSSEFDMREAVLRLDGPYAACNYASIVETQQAALDKLVTVVAPATANSSVQYYNLSGMQINAPKAGEIVIRKTVQGGKVVVDKVLIK